MHAPEDDFSTLFAFLPLGAYRSSPGGRQLRANAALVQLNGYGSEAEMLAAVADIGRDWYVDPGRRGDFVDRLERDGFVVDFVSEIYRHKTRERIWIREAAHVVRDAAGRVRYFEGTVEDVTAQRLTRLALETSERRFRALTERAQGLTMVCDARGTIGYASTAAQLILGVAPEALIGRDVFELIHPEDRDRAHAEYGRVLVFRNSGTESVLRLMRSDGGHRHVACLANNCLADTAVEGVVLNYRDVTGRILAERALRRLADHDDLTGLVNRRCFLDRMGQAMLGSVTRSPARHGLLFIDLDRFKGVNDRHGHRIGDLLLAAVAERLSGCVRAVDTVARFGGDEFVILLQDLGLADDPAVARLGAVGDKILAALNGPHHLDDCRLEIGCSIGATLFGARVEALEDVLRRADGALYRGKQAGRNVLRLAVG